MGDYVQNIECEPDIDEHVEFDPYKEHLGIKVDIPENVQYEPDIPENVESKPDSEDNVGNEERKNEELNRLEVMEGSNSNSDIRRVDPNYNITIDRNAKVHLWISREEHLNVEEPENVEAEEEIERAACPTSGDDTIDSSSEAMKRKRTCILELDKNLTKIFYPLKQNMKKKFVVEKEINYDGAMKTIKENEDKESEVKNKMKNDDHVLTSFIQKMTEKELRSVETQTDKEIQYEIEISEDLMKSCFATKETNATKASEEYVEKDEEYILSSVFIHLKEISFNNNYWNKREDPERKEIRVPTSK
ncbi:UNVERIFIED_CONTAM: hypothetical protein RMT77_005929 [Armadillidium vulgare]